MHRSGVEENFSILPHGEFYIMHEIPSTLLVNVYAGSREVHDFEKASGKHFAIIMLHTPVTLLCRWDLRCWEHPIPVAVDAATANTADEEAYA